MSTGPQQDALVFPFEQGAGKELVDCANPHCGAQFLRTIGRGRPKQFHDDACRLQAITDLRRVQSRIETHRAAIAQLELRAATYTSLASDEPASSGPTAAQLQAAREAFLEVKGMSRFLAGHQGEFAGDLLRLFEAMAPLVDQA